VGVSHPWLRTPEAPEDTHDKVLRNRPVRCSRDGPAHFPRHARGLRCRPRPRLLRIARLVRRVAGWRRRLLPSGRHDPGALGTGQARGGQRRGRPRWLGRRRLGPQRLLAAGGGRRPGRSRGRRRDDRSAGSVHVLGWLLRGVHRPGRSSLGGGPQPRVGARRRRLRAASLIGSTAECFRARARGQRLAGFEQCLAARSRLDEGTL
jgi:hypothetical protein